MTISPVWDDPRVRRALGAHLARRRERLAGGERSIGWKLVFNHAGARARHDISAPLVAAMTDRLVIEPGGIVPSRGWTKPGLEPEIAVHIGEDLPAGCGVSAARAAIAGLGAGVEVIDVDGPGEPLEAVLERGAMFRAAVLGPIDTSRAGGVIDGIEARVSHNGVEVSHNTDPGAAVGADFASLIAHVSDLLGAFGETLRAGDVILSGALTPALYPAPGDRAEFDMGPLGRLAVQLEGPAPATPGTS